MANSSVTGRKVAMRAMMALVVFLAIASGLAFLSTDELYLWIKAIHVVAVMSWMAGMLYLPRLFIYHTDAAPGSSEAETFKIMEARLYRIIMNPAMMISWVLGLWLAWSVYHFQGGWLHVKLLGVVLLTATHIFFGRSVRALQRNEITRTTRFWRLMNEIPTLLMIVIVIMVIVKPFA